MQPIILADKSRIDYLNQIDGLISIDLDFPLNLITKFNIFQVSSGFKLSYEVA
jgi:hypothetical protein